MSQGRNFRVVKRGLACTEATAALPVAGANATRAETEREMRRVVAGWVSEHRRADEELRRALSHALFLRV